MVIDTLRENICYKWRLYYIAELRVNSMFNCDIHPSISLNQQFCYISIRSNVYLILPAIFWIICNATGFCAAILYWMFHSIGSFPVDWKLPESQKKIFIGLFMKNVGNFVSYIIFLFCCTFYDIIYWFSFYATYIAST